MASFQPTSIRGTLPHVIPTLLKELRRTSPGRAETITCVNWWVLVGIRTNEIKDTEMVAWLLDDIVIAFNEVAPPSTAFGLREPDQWGYWPYGDTECLPSS